MASAESQVEKQTRQQSITPVINRVFKQLQNQVTPTVPPNIEGKSLVLGKLSPSPFFSLLSVAIDKCVLGIFIVARFLSSSPLEVISDAPVSHASFVAGSACYNLGMLVACSQLYELPPNSNKFGG